MTRRQRTYLFFTFFFLFTVSTPLLLLYYAGYRFDFQQRTITQTGALYMKIVPKNASVLVRPSIAEKTDWLFGTILIDNLLPKSYSVLVEKEGYVPWEKTLGVKAREVTEAKNILLIPQLLQTKSLLEGIEKFWVSPNYSFLLLQKSSPQKGRSLSIVDRQKNTENVIWKNLTGTIASVSWRKDSDAILIQIKGSAGFSYLLYKAGEDVKELKFFGKDVDRVEFASSAGSAILLEKPSSKGNSLLLGDYGTQTLSTPFASPVVNFSMLGDTLFWIDAKGVLWEKEILSSSLPSPLTTPASLKAPFALYPTEKGIFLLQGTSLMLLNKALQRFEPIQEHVQEFSLSPDGKKIALQKGNEISLFFLEEDADQPKHTKGETVSVATFNDPVSNLAWITSHYLLFSTGNKLNVTEIDTRDKVNVTELGISFSSPFFWDDKEKTLLLLNAGVLSLSEKLL